MSWQAKSPDISIIENSWLLIKRKHQGRASRIETKEDYICEIQLFWTKIKPLYVFSL